MPDPRHLRVFLSSPGDVTEERQIVRDLVRNELAVKPALRGRVTYDVVSWDDPHAAAPMPAHLTPQAALEAGLPRPSECDIVVVVFWARLGTPLPPEFTKKDGSRYLSGTEYEYLDAVEAARRGGSPVVMLYRRRGVPKVPLNMDEEERSEARRQLEALETFLGQFCDEDGALTGSVHEYDAPGALRDLAAGHLEQLSLNLLADSSPGGATSTVCASSELPVESVIDALDAELDFIDQDFHYQSRWFTPLDARVRVRSGSVSSDDSAQNLLDALESQPDTRLFVVLGLPGSGKSVAMREFARHGLKRTAETGVLPIYVNLRDWLPERRWTEDEPPTRGELEAFLSKRLAFPDQPALAHYFRSWPQRHTDGHLAWIFDSFDELPAILDAGAGPTDALIRRVSRLLHDFVLEGSRDHRGPRGILASRYERRPELPPARVTQVEIQPFSDDRIRDAFHKLDEFPRHLTDELFRPPGTLVPLARTPFYHNLIAEFAIATERLPSTASELFDSYVRRRVVAITGGDADSLGEEVARSLELAERIAHFLFASERYGLGCPVQVLRDQFPSSPMDRAVGLLHAARLVRLGGPPDEVLTFAHRRIHEYFLVRCKTRRGEPFELKWVTEDTRERDSAVLHVELANDDEAREIALACWREIQAGEGLSYSDPAFFRALHCQRFMVEAFRTRRELITPFRDELEGLVARRIEDSDDLISVVLATESLGLLSEGGVERNMLSALKRGDFWIRETAIDACRFLPSLPPRVVGHVWRSIAFLREDVFLRDIERLRFSFRLSPSLEEVAELVERRLEDLIRWRRRRWLVLALAPAGAILAWSASKFAATIFTKPPTLNDTHDNLQLMYTSDLSVLLAYELVPDDYPQSKLTGEQGKPESPKFEQALDDWIAAATRSNKVGLPTPRAMHASLAYALVNGMAFLMLALPITTESDAVTNRYFNMAALLAIWLPIAAVIRYIASRHYPLHCKGERETHLRTMPLLQRIARTVRDAALTVGVATVLLVAIPLLLNWWLGISPLTSAVWIAGVPTGVGFVALLALIARTLASNIRNKRHDIRRIDHIVRTLPHDRPAIAQHFGEFETTFGRLKYVEWLDTRNASPAGEWPDGHPPNLGDTASTKLAMLEHRWRGLNR